MPLDDLVAKFESFTNPIATETPDIDQVLAGVTEVYNSDIAVRDQAVNQYKAKVEEKEATIAKLQQHNYELLLKQPAGNVIPDNGKQTDPADDEAERAATIKVADLFTKRK